jgi:hypothetical protein
MDVPHLEPVALRLAVGGLSLALAVRGRQFWRLAIATPGALLGTALGVSATKSLGTDPTTGLVICAVLALAGVALALFVERLAVLVSGATAGAVIGLAVAPLLGPAAWWPPLVGFLLGALLGTWIYRKMVPVFSAAVGAYGIAWAAGWPPTALVLGALFLAGLTVQLLSGGPSDPDAET